MMSQQGYLRMGRGLAGLVLSVILCTGCAGKLSNPVVQNVGSLSNTASGMVYTHVDGERLIEPGKIKLLGVSSDSRYVAIDSDGSSSKLVDLQGDEVVQLTDELSDFSFSRDGIMMGICSQAGAYILDTQSGRRIQMVDNVGECRWVDFSNDDKLFAALCGDKVRVVDIESRAVLFECRPEGRVSFAEFLPGSGRLVVASRESGLFTDEFVRIYNLSNGQIEHEYMVEGRRITQLAVSPDARFIAFGAWANVFNGGPTVEVLNVSTGRKVFSWGTNNVEDVKFSSDSRMLAIAEMYPTRVSVYDLSSGVALHELKSKGVVESAAFSPNNRYLAMGIYNVEGFGLSGATVLYDLVGQRVLYSQITSGMTSKVVFLPDGEALVSSGGAGVRLIPLSGLVSAGADQ